MFPIDRMTCLAQDLTGLKAQLESAQEKEILLLEAYEALERDIGKEVDRALAAQKDQLDFATRKCAVLEKELSAEKAKFK